MHFQQRQKRFLAYRSQSTSPAQQFQQARGFGKYFIRYNRRVSFDDVLAVLSWITLSGGAFFVFKTTTAVSLLLQACELTGAKSLLISELNKQLDNTRVQKQSLFSFLKNNSSINVNIGDITTSTATTASDTSSNSQDGEGERVLTLHNVHIIRDKSTIQQHSSDDDNNDALNVAYFDVTIDRINFSLDFVRWIDGKGLIKSLDVDGVNGTVNKRHVVYPPPDPALAALSVEEDLMQDLVIKGQQLMGSHSKTCLDSFKMSNLHLDILDVQNFRPYSIQLDYIDCSDSGLRLQWFVPDLMSASALKCTYDGAAISLDRIQYQKQEQQQQYQQIADTSEWIQHLRVTGLNVDMVNWNSKPPLNWITQGFVDFDIYCHIPDYSTLSADDIVQSLQDEQLLSSANQAPTPIVTDQFNLSVISMTQDVPPSTQTDQQSLDDSSLQDQVDQMKKDISDRVSQTYRQYLIDQLYSMIVKQKYNLYGKQEVDDAVQDSSGPRDEEDFTSFGSAVELIELNDLPGDSQHTAVPNGNKSEIGGDKLQRLLRPSINSNCSFIVSAHVRDLEVRVSEVLLLNGRKISPAWTKSMMNYVNSYSSIAEQNTASTNGADNGGGVGDVSNGETPRRRLHVEFEHPYLHFYSAWNIYDSKLATMLNKKFSERFGEIVSEWLSELVRRRSVDRGLTKSIKGDLSGGNTSNISDGSKDAQSINLQTRAWWNWGWFQQKPLPQQGQDYTSQSNSQLGANDTNIRQQLEMQSNGELLLNLLKLRARAIAPAAPQMFTKSFDHYYSMQDDYQVADWFDFQE
ncbi:hypothetical protein MIR68_008916 [Amoeboaphelidium protococcarum]|nr:hypothetical protein MIR68_008916 [Amoeboaphelidium protococcarum]